MAGTKQPDLSNLKTFANAAAGHDGVMEDDSGEIVVKPCTQAEIDFYQETSTSHPAFYELMPTYMGTLSLGSPTLPADPTIASEPELTQEEKDSKRLHGQKLTTKTSIVLENLEHGFKRPNVLDLKLGSRLYADGTEPEKAARLDKVAVESTSGSLNFRIAGMKVWNGQSYDIYDKFYGRKFDASNVIDGFAAFFASLSAGGVRTDEACELLETILAEISLTRHTLERAESRMYGASILIVFEGDNDALDTIIGGVPKTPRAEEKAPTQGELNKSVEEEVVDAETGPVTHRVKMIDFAHAKWTPGLGRDENVIKGLKSVEDQMDLLIARFE